MPDDRDFRRPKTPPAGVRAQTARPLEERIPRIPPPPSLPPATTEPYEDFDDLTPVDGDVLQQLQTRARNASANARGAFHATRELRGELARAVERDMKDHETMVRAIERVDGKVDRAIEHVADVRADVSGVVNRLDVIMRSMEDERRARIETDKARELAQLEIAKTKELAEAEVKKVTEITKVKVTETQQIAAVDETKASAEHRRKIRYRIVVALLSAFTLLVGLLTKC